MSGSEHFVRACVRDVLAFILVVLILVLVLVLVVIIVSWVALGCIGAGVGELGKNYFVDRVLGGCISIPGWCVFSDFGYFDLFCTAEYTFVFALLIEESTTVEKCEYRSSVSDRAGLDGLDSVMPLPQPDDQVAQLTQTQVL